ncbi:cytochrome c peroxidase [Rhizobium sp. NFACC06-2]|uniref:cytochrome-c peroxidase n=1 Tax=Rhizobium sp. NFACC06-2 TaxID=1566264 RepID=UPI000876F3F4|nr:cytochrome c peroxidase [Rhizobium sp. NFACC06-2]SCY92358.1 cytochrome c peroxidase [Rhizobium sp. NFACC06-2]
MKGYRRVLAAAVGLCVSLSDPSLGFDRNEPIAPLPEIDRLDAGKVALGRSLFFDPILSSDASLSCASCHDPAVGGTVRTRRPTGKVDGRPLFNVPTIFNVANNQMFGWRGSIRSLVEQNEKVLLDPNLMGAQWGDLLLKLNGLESYAGAFREAYGSPPTREALLDAIGAYEISLRTPGSPFDRYIRGDLAALKPLAIEGYVLFKDYGCASCHQGSNVGGNMSQKLGIFNDNNSDFLEPPFEGTTDQDDRRSTFRVPSLRNVAKTSPYFHDGRTLDLAEAISQMGRLQLGRKLSQNDIAALRAFLESLTGNVSDLPQPQLHHSD